MKKCKGCNKNIKMEKLVLKLGGLLCPHCRVVVYQPYVDKEYFKEVNRRKKDG